MAIAAQGQAGTQAGRPNPQTTGQPDTVGPFIRHSRQSVRPGYAVSGLAYSATVDQPLSQAPGYLRFLDVSIVGTAGSGAAGTVSADTTVSMANVIGFVQMKDAYGTVVFSGNGFEMGFLVPLFSGQVGIMNAANPNLWPGASALTTLGAGRYYFRIPFEIGGVGGYGTLAVGNAALQPALHWNVNSSGSTNGIFSTNPGTTQPTFAIFVDEAYYAIPVDIPTLEPPALGTTLQWLQMVCNPTVGSASSQRVQLPRLGGYLTTLILEGRDANGVRQDTIFNAGTLGLNNRIRLYIDGVPVKDESIDQRLNEMFVEFPVFTGTYGTFVRPAGVIAYSFKNAESQAVLGYLDSLEGAVATSPGSLVEVELTPWGSFTGPATITAIIGQIVPKGQVVYGLEG